MNKRSAFWDDLQEDLRDPEFTQAYITESVRVRTIDSIINQLDTARERDGRNKAELARAINADPATVRRLFSSRRSNPTLGTLAELAAALGMKISLEPLDDQERHAVTEPLWAEQEAPREELVIAEETPCLT